MVTMTMGEMDVIDLAADVCKAFGASFEACGSRVTQRSLVGEESDFDFLVHVMSGVNPKTKQFEDPETRLPHFMDALENAGFKWEGSNEHYQHVAASSFMSYRQGKVNLIVTTNGAFAMRHRAATHVCRTLGFLDKQSRVMVFQACLYGAKWDPEAAAVIA